MRSLRRAPTADALGKHLRGLLLIAMLAVGTTLQPAAAATRYEADAVKAAFLHRFAAYVEWPPEAAARAPFTIAVLGAPGVVENLQRLLPTLRIQNREARVRSIEPGDATDDVHILYVGPEQLARAQKLVSAAQRRPILIVTDEVEGLPSGAVINFVQVDRNLRFEVSLTGAKDRRLQLSAGLLSVAVRIVDERADRGVSERPQQFVIRSLSSPPAWNSIR